MKLRLRRFLLAGFLALAAGQRFSATAQTISITYGVQKYASLTGTTVDMSGRCELWVTNSAPLSGCTINLDSSDSWLFLPGVAPTVAVSSYLNQIVISGAVAVADSNCRVVQYGQSGAVIIPQAPSFQPLTVFTGAEFTGTATSYGQWTRYAGAAYVNVRSFKLKRGYQVVLAQSANGANFSKCYVAQDGDLEVGVLPATLDKQVQFICVTPWRWIAKKGIAGSPPYSRLNVNWWYNWNLDQTSSHDLEYVAIRQQPFWPSLNQNWQSLGINTVLGYNEPDNSGQDAYKNLTPTGSVTNAVARQPDQLATGLRVGSPATTDGGRSSWLYPFVSQADSAGYRVDFIAIHYYWAWNPADASGAATQMYNFLLDIWNNTHRPIWITEWNNGANWTDNSPYASPTYAQQQACIAAMTQMLENTPFVERYSLYNWVEDTRSLVTSSNTVTPAGTTYSNLISHIGYSQAMPDNGTPGLAEYLFATNFWDTSGYFNNAMAIGAPTFAAGHSVQASAIALDGTNTYLQLPANIARASAFTFAAWVYWNGGNSWQRIFDFGNPATSQNGPSQYLFLTPSSGSGTLRFAIDNGGGEQIVQSSGPLASGSWQHVAITLSNNVAALYVNGAAVAISNNFSIAPSAISPIKNYLGKSQFTADPLFNGKLDEVEIADYAMSAAQISVLYHGAQNPNYISGIWMDDADGDWSANTNWNAGVIPNGPSRMADFSTINLTADRIVTVDSARTVGGLRFGDTTGTQNWTVAGGNTLTLDGGGANPALIAVNQNTATISAPISGKFGFTKTGGGMLILNGADNVGGGLTVSAGAVSITGGVATFGNTTSSIGYLTGSGNLAVSNCALAMGGELRVGGSDQSGLQYMATGAVSIANATVSVGALTVARGNYLDNTMSGTVTLNAGGTLISTNDVIVEFAGKGRGKVAINGGSFIIGPTATKWLMVGYYDTGGGELDLTNGNLLLENGTSLKMCRSGNTGTNIVNQLGGKIIFYSDAGTTIGGGGNLDLSYAGASASVDIYNLNGGMLTVPQIVSSSTSGTRVFNFNGGTLKAAGSGNGFFAAGMATAANVRNRGAAIDTANLNITVGQRLIHSTIAGDSATDGGLTKNGAGTLTLNGANTYTGSTVINNGTLAMGNAGSIASSEDVVVMAGATLDVSAISGGFILGAAQTLAGNGAVNGTVVNNGTIAPGQPLGSFATLTLNNAPVLNGTVLLQIDRNSGSPRNDEILLPSSTINYGGTLTVVNTGAALQSGDSFKLFTAPVYAGAFALTNLPALNPGLAWSNSLALNGIIAVMSAVSLAPANIVVGMDGTNLLLSWPADRTGWRLEAQTNSPGGLGTNWLTVPGSADTNQMTFPINTASSSVFYRLVYP